MIRRSWLLVALPLVAVSCKKGFGANFEGELSMHTTRADGPAREMVVEAKGDKLRFDTDGFGGKSYAIYDPSVSPNRLVMVMDAQKAYSDLDFSSPSSPQANTSGDTAAIDKDGKKETIAGVDCQTWTAKDPSGKRSEVCLAEGIAFFDIGSLTGRGAALSKTLRDKKLFPLRSVEYDASGKEISRTEVTKIDRKKIDDSRFAVPAGYTKLDRPAM